MAGLIRPARSDDAAAIAEIYAPFVLETAISFEEAPPEAPEMARRMKGLVADYPYLVIEDAGAVCGYAYAGPFRTRPAYSRTAETTVYVARDCQGRGFGHALYARLIAMLKEAGMHVLIGGITLPNPASVALHRRLGFRPVGVLRQVGRKFGRWHDVELWQSTIGGSDG
ncbi:MAG: arsinothricin resistance N-acetyltransferase ArsN1 family B [Pseudomonadota bacterium]